MLISGAFIRFDGFVCKADSSIVFVPSPLTSRTWCLKQHGRKSGTWWRGRSSGSAPPSRRCAAAPCLWARLWTTYRRTWTPCRLSCRPGARRTRSTRRPCCRNRGGFGTSTLFNSCFLHQHTYRLVSLRLFLNDIFCSLSAERQTRQWSL